MRNFNSSLYNLIIRKLQISDDIIHSFKKELECYKQFYNQIKTAWAADAFADFQNNEENDFLHE